MQTFFNPELFNLIRTLVIGGDASELEQILAEGGGLVQHCDGTLSDSELETVRDRCHLTLLDLDSGVLKQFAVSPRVFRQFPFSCFRFQSSPSKFEKLASTMRICSAQYRRTYAINIDGDSLHSRNP